MSHQNHVEFGNHSLGRTIGRTEQEIRLTQFIQATMREEARRAYQYRTNPPRIVGGNIVYD